jgi:hypothetical protein
MKEKRIYIYTHEPCGNAAALFGPPFFFLYIGKKGSGVWHPTKKNNQLKRKKYTWRQAEKQKQNNELRNLLNILPLISLFFFAPPKIMKDIEPMFILFFGL